MPEIIYIVDRIEGDYAVCIGESGSADIPLEDISCSVAEGSRLIYDTESRKYILDSEGTERAIRENKRRLDSLFERGK